MLTNLEFTEHQRNVFCVFSGRGVTDLRTHLNNQMGDIALDINESEVMSVNWSGEIANVVNNLIPNGNADDEDADGDEELDAEVEGA